MRIHLFSIPNLLTLGNLLCGASAATVVLTEGNLVAAFWLIVAGACFDFFDGFAARLLKQTSPMGVQLDSLADAITFGFAPAALLYRVCMGVEMMWLPSYACYGVFVLTAFSALRLARFNIDTEQATEFRGLPTPAGGLLCASVGLLWGHLLPGEAVLVLAIATACLLICPVRMFSLKFHGFGWWGNELRYLFLAACAVLVATLWLHAVPAIIVLYILVSILRHLCCKC